MIFDCSIRIVKLKRDQKLSAASEAQGGGKISENKKAQKKVLVVYQVL